MKREEMTRNPRRGPVFLGLTVVATLGWFASSGCAAKGPELTVSWGEHDDTNTDAIDHSEWQAILDGYLRTDDPSGIHLFDYGGLKANAADRGRLQGYLAHLGAVDPRLYSRDEQMAYWINFYNALTVETVVEGHPVGSIKNIHDGIVPLSGPWGDKRATVAGQRLSLDNMEHDILRALWRDPRIHYAVNCASLGCPNLAPQVFTAASLEEMMDAAARGYVNHPRGVELMDEMFGVVSSIYTWFQEDFGGSEAGVVEHLLRHAEPELAEQLKGFEGGFDYEYDWDLNDAP
jgi:hypothetical protein